MTGKIFLSGGGDEKQTFDLDEFFFSQLKFNQKILYIPVALNLTSFKVESCYDWFSSIISIHAADKDIDFEICLEENQINDLTKYSAIYMGGGNTYKLLNFIYESGLVNKIPAFIKNNGIVYGGSAGAVVLGSDIRTVSEENDKNYYHHKGLNLLNNKSIICHYEPQLNHKIIKSSETINSDIIALKEDSGLIYDQEGNLIKIVSDVFEFNKSSIKKL